MASATDGSEYYRVDLEARMSGRFGPPSTAESGMDDEEELVWAAIQRLPSQRQPNFAVVRGAGGKPAASVDVRKLHRAGRERLLNEALATTEQDNYNLMVGINQRFRRVGLSLPKVEVRFENLKVTADVYFGKSALTSLPYFVRDTLEGLLTSLRVFRPKKHTLTILDGVTSCVKPERMTLLLGPPASRKSTLLKALAGKLDSIVKTSGDISYNGHPLNSFNVHMTFTYVGQTDNHISELNVWETFDYAARFQGARDAFAGYMGDLKKLEA